MQYKKMRKNIKKTKKSINSKLFILAFLIGATFLSLIPTIQYKLVSHGQFDGSNFVPEEPKNNLQLYWFLLPIDSPTPHPLIPPLGNLCSIDDDNGVQVPATCSCIDLAVTCKNGVPYNDDGTVFSINDPNVIYGGPQSDLTTLCKGSKIAPGEGRYCIAKPVVYLYPTAPTLVNVRVESLGKVVVSDPLYPEGGWKNVLAYPNGNLSYKGKNYSELFFETEVENMQKPKKGIVLQTSLLNEQLGAIVEQLGLSASEKDEFLQFWIPRLKGLNSPYIFFSLLEKTEKEKLDKLIITPKPDTVIEFIAYFKPLDTDTYGNSLKLPPTPKRKGFVSVEWGGILDN